MVQQWASASVMDRLWRVVLLLGFALARVWWRVRRPRHQGALVAMHVGAELLLLRSSYRRGWNFPGGGVRAGEAPETAARREMVEEIGLDVADPSMPAMIAAAAQCGVWDGREERVHMFELRLERLPPLRLDGREIVAARLVSLAEARGLPLTGPVAGYVASL